MRSPRKIWIERFGELTDPTKRYIDVACRFQLFVRGSDDLPKPTDKFSRVYGGRYDTWSHTYVDTPPEHIATFSAHEGQFDLLTMDYGNLRHILVEGSPGYGKTDLLILWLCRDICELPNRPQVYTAPVGEKLDIGWDKFERLAEPHGWIQNKQSAKRRFLMANNALVWFKSTKKQSEALGSPVAGIDADRAKCDESQNMTDGDLREIEERGRTSKSFLSVETATNERIPEYRRRKREYKRASYAKVVHVNGMMNCFTPTSHWERLREQYPPDEYKRKILGLDVPDFDAIYTQFSDENVARVPPGYLDITSREVQSILPDLYDIQWVLGTDFGITVHVSTACRIYLDPKRRNERLYWAEAEIITRMRTADYHGANIIKWCQDNNINPSTVLLIGDPHSNKSEEDPESDYKLIRKSGLTCIKADVKNISRKHRYTMVNTLLRDTNSNRRLFIACDDDGRSLCPKLEESFYGLKYRRSGVAPEAHGKDPELDLTHYTDSIGYMLWKWERFRGQAAYVKKDRAGKWALEKF